MKNKTPLLRFLLLLQVFFCLLGTLTGCYREEEPLTVTVRELTWATSTPLPKAAEFVSDLPAGATVRYAEQYTFSAVGSYDLELIVTEESGRESRHAVKFNLVIDQTPPTIVGLVDRSVYLGGTVSYLNGVTVTDNCDGETSLAVDTSAVDLKTEGVYPVRYTATDAAGNQTTVRVSVSVYQNDITEEMLWEKLDPVIDQIITKSMTTEQKARAVHEYVYDHVNYVSTSDKSGWVRGAYEGLTTGRGDCYTYFALSKAFFERLDIENRDLQRIQSAVALVDERHFWNYINIGSSESPIWYHFDACRIKDQSYPWGCLMTDAQLAAFSADRVQNGVRNYFYAFDKELCPPSATTVLTPVN